MPKLQKQACGSNNRAVFAAADVADICHGSPVPGAIYVDSQQQRSWLFEVLKTRTLIQCPRLVEKPSSFVETNPPQCNLSAS